MSQKRQERGEGTASDEKRPRNFRTWSSVVRDVMHLRKIQSIMEPVLEPLIRRVVKEEIESAFRNYVITMKHAIDEHPRESMSLRLQFLNSISLPVFTGTRIEGKGCSSLEVALVNIHTGNIVSSGPGSSAEVEIVALEGDFDGDDRDSWTLEDFKSNIVRERAGKKPLLNGDVKTTLENGKGLVGDIMFTDNSSWTRSRKFRLGARVVDDTGQTCVREARSEPFIVRDHRGELYKKHHPPSLSDEVWRLEKIGKDGAFHKRLRKENINTVEDFLLLLSLDSDRLRKILGTGMSTKMWEVTAEHSRTCVPDDKLYLYNAPQKNSVVFNIMGQVKGTLSDGQFIPVDNLSEAEKEDACELVISYAFEDRDKIVTFDDASINNNTVPTSSNLSNFPYEGDDYDQDLGSHQIKRSIFLPQTPTSPEFIYSIGGLSNFDGCLESVDHVGTSYDQSLTYPGEASSDILISDEQLSYFDGTGSSFPCSSFDVSEINAFIPCSKVSAAQKGWTVLFSVIRWCFSLKRIVRNSRVAQVPTYCS